MGGTRGTTSEVVLQRNTCVRTHTHTGTAEASLVTGQSRAGGLEPMNFPELGAGPVRNGAKKPMVLASRTLPSSLGRLSSRYYTDAYLKELKSQD